MKKRIALLAFVCLLLAASCALAKEHDKHGYGSWRTKRAATCTQTGLQFKYCNGCDHWEKRELPRLPHDVAEWTVTTEPTCTSIGFKRGYCAMCESDVTYVMEELEHAYDEGTIITEPTCLKAGKAEYTCTGCGRKKTGSVDKLGHTSDEWTVTKEPKGANKGTRKAICARCGEEVTERFYWEGSLYEDMEPCDEVIYLQHMLSELGYYKGSIRTGSFGNLTGRSVAKFRVAQGLESSTVADPDTIELLRSVFEETTGKSAQELTVEQILLQHAE